MTDPEDAELREPAPEPATETAAPAPDPYPFWGWQDVLILTALVLPLLIAAQMAVWAAFNLTGWSPKAKALGPLLATFLFYGLWFIGLYQWIRIRYNRPFWRSLAWTTPPRGAWYSASWGVLVAFASILLAVVLRPPAEKTPLEQLLEDDVSILLTGLFAISLGPVCEELAFRGFLMPLVVRRLGGLGGVIVTAVPFTLLHGFEYAWSWQRLSVILFAGAAFGWMRYRSGSTAAAAVMHSTYNLTFFLGFLLQKAR